MKSLTEQNRRVCEAQAEVFEASLELSPCGSAVFIRRFMRSSVAKRIDGGSLPFETSSAAQLVEEVDEEYGGKGYGSVRYAANELYWMGYVYRAWSLAYGLPSKAVYAQIGARELRALYYPYHTLDPLDAIARIREAAGIQDDVARGVEILRRLRKG